MEKIDHQKEVDRSQEQVDQEQDQFLGGSFMGDQGGFTDSSPPSDNGGGGAITQLKTMGPADENSPVAQMRRIQEAANNSPRVMQLKSYQRIANSSSQVRQLSTLQEGASGFGGDGGGSGGETPSKNPVIQQKPIPDGEVVQRSVFKPSSSSGVLEDDFLNPPVVNNHEENVDPVNPVQENVDPVNPVQENVGPVNPVQENVGPVNPVQDNAGPENEDLSIIANDTLDMDSLNEFPGPENDLQDNENLGNSNRNYIQGMKRVRSWIKETTISFSQNAGGGMEVIEEEEICRLKIFRIDMQGQTVTISFDLDTVPDNYQRHLKNKLQLIMLEQEDVEMQLNNLVNVFTKTAHQARSTLLENREEFINSSGKIVPMEGGKPFHYDTKKKIKDDYDKDPNKINDDIRMDPKTAILGGDKVKYRKVKEWEKKKIKEEEVPYSEMSDLTKGIREFEKDSTNNPEALPPSYLTARLFNKGFKKYERDENFNFLDDIVNNRKEVIIAGEWSKRKISNGEWTASSREEIEEDRGDLGLNTEYEVRYLFHRGYVWSEDRGRMMPPPLLENNNGENEENGNELLNPNTPEVNTNEQAENINEVVLDNDDENSQEDLRLNDDSDREDSNSSSSEEDDGNVDINEFARAYNLG